MLEGLESVPWSLLSHAYGPADDVPALIRALGSLDSKERQHALYELYGNIWHQGTIYEATSYAVPFLLELAADPETPERSHVLSLVGSIAEGNSFVAVHKDLPFYQTDHYAQQEKIELEWVDNTRRAVSAGWPVLIGCFEEADHPISTAAAYVITRFPENGLEVLNLLKERFERAEADSLLQTGFMMLIKDFAAQIPGTEDWARSVFLGKFALPVRIAAAVAVARGERQRTPSDVIGFLTHHLIGNDEIDQAFSIQPWDKLEPVPEIVDALFLSDQGRRLAIARFNQLLGSHQDQKRLRYCDHALRNALQMADRTTRRH